MNRIEQIEAIGLAANQLLECIRTDEDEHRKIYQLQVLTDHKASPWDEGSMIVIARMDDNRTYQYAAYISRDGRIEVDGS